MLFGLIVYDLMLLLIECIWCFFDDIVLLSVLFDDVLKLLFVEVCMCLKYLCDVGFGYLMFDW